MTAGTPAVNKLNYFMHYEIDPELPVKDNYGLKLICLLSKHKIYAAIHENHPRFKTIHFVYKEPASYVPQEGGGAYRTHHIVFSGTITIDAKEKKVTAWDYDTDEMEKRAIQLKLNLTIQKILS